MENPRQLKQAVVKEISEKIARSKSVVIAEYHGLTVSQIEELRNKLRESDVELKVYKNRLFKLASHENNIDFDSVLNGPNTFAFGMSDDISPAKILAAFAKEHEALKIKAGTYEGKVLDNVGIMEVALLPTYDEALGILARSMMAPLKDMAVSLNLLVEEEKIGSTAIEKEIVEEVKNDVNTEDKQKVKETKEEGE